VKIKVKGQWLHFPVDKSNSGVIKWKELNSPRYGGRCFEMMEPKDFWKNDGIEILRFETIVKKPLSIKYLSDF